MSEVETAGRSTDRRAPLSSGLGPAGTVAGVYRFLWSRQWVSLALIAVVLMPVMYKLGFWQMHRHEQVTAQNKLIADNLKAKPLPVTDLTFPGHTVPYTDYWRRVTATGRFDTSGEVVVRRRTSNDDVVGYFVLAPLILNDGRAVLVNRGWIQGSSNQTTFPRVPAPPQGVVTVTGLLQADETSASSGIKNVQGLPPRQVMLINSKQQSKVLRRTVLGGYIAMTAPTPPGDTPQQVALPDDTSIGFHFTYAIQWWMFVAGVPIGFWVLVRREKRDREEAATRANGAASEGAGPEPGSEPAAATLAPGSAAEPARSGPARSGSAGSGSAGRNRPRWSRAWSRPFRRLRRIGPLDRVPTGRGRPGVTQRMEDDALIGDLQTAALVRGDGSIDWMCLPRFGSAACFAALRGTEDNRHWRISPKGAGCCARHGTLRAAAHLRNDVGLLAEEYDSVAGRQLGNVQEAFSHIGLVGAALALAGE